MKAAMVNVLEYESIYWLVLHLNKSNLDEVWQRLFVVQPDH